MLRTRFVCLCLGGLAVALAAASCGGSAAVTGSPAEAPPVAGSAIVQGTVTGAAAGVQVGVVGTPVVAELDQEGQFVLSNVPPGTATLSFQGGGVDARLSVPGIQNGLVTSIKVQLSGGTAQLTATPNCGPSAETAFSGILEQMSGASLVVGGRAVDASQVNKVWRDGKRIQLSELRVGEKLKVWGTVRGDGTVLAEEIEARTAGGAGPRVQFRGVIEGVSASATDVHVDCETTGSPTFVISGHEVRTNGTTRFKWSDGSSLSPGEIRVGDHALVVGDNKGSHILAEKIAIDLR